MNFYLNYYRDNEMQPDDNPPVGIILGIVSFVWLALIVAMFPTYPDPPPWLLAASLIYPIFYTAVSLYEYNRRPRT